jgi:hypothetical protein
MTWGGTEFFFEIVTLETGDMGDMAQKVLFWTHWRQVTGPLHSVKFFFRKCD